MRRFVAIRKRWWVIGTTVFVALVVVSLALVAARMPLSSDRLRRKVVETIAARMEADVELGEITVRLLPTVRISGAALNIRHKGRRDVPPLIGIDTFTVDAALMDIWRGHVARVNLTGLKIQIPPKPPNTDSDSQKPDPEPKVKDSDPTPSPVEQVVIDEVVADEASLTILPGKPDKRPRVWAMHKLHIENVGLGLTMPFRSELTNAVPPGEITTSGSFGPWHADEPGDTPLAGNFTFAHADLSVFKGISGILSAQGSYGGSLDTIDVKGQTETPDFMVKVSGHAVPLTAKYHAIIDGTNGDTKLEQIDATFVKTSLVARGGVYDQPGAAGRLVTLDITMDQGRLEDLMRLAVPTPRPPMTGAIALRTKFDLPPGDKDVVEKLLLNGRFAINGGKFTDQTVQSKIAELSERASVGEKKKQAQGPPVPVTITSDFTGRFALGNGLLRLPSVTFDVPGAAVQLAGQYALRQETIAFSGNLYMDAKISQTMTGWKSWLLKPIDPLFRKDGRTVVPLRISGTRNAPSFGLDVKRVFNKDDTPVPPSRTAPTGTTGTKPKAKS